MFKKIVVSALFLVLPFCVHALSETDVRIAEKDLQDLGLSITRDKYVVSPEVLTLDDKFARRAFYKGQVPQPKKQFYTSTKGVGSKASIYYYEFKSRKEALEAFDFIKGFIWNASAPSEENPERIINVDNYVIVISSPERNYFDELLNTKLIYMPATGEFIVKLQKRLQCKTFNFDTACGVLQEFVNNKKFQALKETVLPAFGLTWTFDGNGKLKETLTKTMEIKMKEGTMQATWIDFKPKDDTEKSKYYTVLKEQKAGKYNAIPSEIKTAMETLSEASTFDILMKNNNTYYLRLPENKVALLKRVKNGMILLSTTEQWTGTQDPFTVSYFWYKR